MFCSLWSDRRTAAHRRRRRRAPLPPVTHPSSPGLRRHVDERVRGGSRPVRGGAVRARARVRAQERAVRGRAVVARGSPLRESFLAVRGVSHAAHLRRRPPVSRQRALGPRVRRRARAPRGRRALWMPMRRRGDRRALSGPVSRARRRHGPRRRLRLHVAPRRHDRHAARVPGRRRRARPGRPRAFRPPHLHHRPRPRRALPLAQARVAHRPKPFAVVTCVEALDACIDYELGVFGQEEDPHAWEVYRDPTHAKYGVFVTPPRDVALAEWAATRPVPAGAPRATSTPSDPPSSGGSSTTTISERFARWSGGSRPTPTTRRSPSRTPTRTRTTRR